MKKKKGVYSIVYILIAILLFQAVSGCASRDEYLQGLGIEWIYDVAGSGYAIGKWHDGYYIVFDNPYKYETSEKIFSARFDSVKEMKDRLINGTLTDAQKKAFVKLSRSDSKLEIFDLDKVYDAKLPQDTQVSDVYMNGTTYSIYLKFNRTIAEYAWIDYLDKDSYVHEFALGYRQYFGIDNEDLKRVEELGDSEKRVLYRRSSPYANVRYQVTRGEEIVIVDKEYYLSRGQTTLDEEKDTLAAVTMYCTQGDIYYIVTLTQFTEVPTDEWLLQIGLEKYAE